MFHGNATRLDGSTDACSPSKRVGAVVRLGLRQYDQVLRTFHRRLHWRLDNLSVNVAPRISHFRQKVGGKLVAGGNTPQMKKTHAKFWGLYSPASDTVTQSDATFRISLLCAYVWTDLENLCHSVSL